MLSISAKIRKEAGKELKSLRKKGILPAVLYGPEIDSQSIELGLLQFQKVFQEAGESSLISLEVGGKKYPVLIHDIQNDPISGEPIHVDFYQPILTEEVEVEIPIIFEGEAPAIKDLGGTLVKEIQEIEVSALPQNLPHEIKVNVECLKTFEDEILIKDLKIPEGVKISRDPNEIVALVVPLTKVEEELEKPVEEEAEKVEGVEEEKKEEKVEEKEGGEKKEEEQKKETKESKR